MLQKTLSLLCPIEKKEWGLVFKFSGIMSLITANFWLLHNLKDTLILTAPYSGAECINYLKVVVFFSTLLFVMGYSKVFSYYTQRQVLTFLVCAFATLVLIFSFLLPYASVLQMDYESVARLQKKFPAFGWVFPVLCYWFFSAFYVLAEMWSMTCYSILFWQFANTVLTLEQSKRYYSIFILFNGLSTIFLAMLVDSLPFATAGSFDDYLIVMRVGCLTVVLLCFFMLLGYRSIYKYYGEPHAKKEARTVHLKEHAPFWKSLHMVIRSWYLGLVFLLGICYNLAHTLVDVTWKQQVKLQCSTPFAVQEFFWKFTLKMGYGIVLCALVGSSFIHRMGWRFGASITPALLCLSGTLFFASILLRSWELGTFTTVMFAVHYGQWHELIVRSLKHSIFNVTRELVYIPLDFHSQVRGKAVADVLGGRVGKLVGAFSQGVLLFFVAGGTQADTVPYAIMVFWCTIAVWFIVITMLNKRFLKLVAYKKM